MPKSSYALWSLLLAMSLSLCGCGCRRGPEPLPEPEADPVAYNLVFVSFDALQAAHVGSLGYHRDTTPTIDAFARGGHSFLNAYSVASWTVPASMTWFTGVYPSEHRMTNKFAIYAPPVKKTAKLKELAPNLVTLADILKQNGYATAGFTGNAGVSGGFGYEQGFDVYFHENDRFGGLDRSIPEALKWLRANSSKKFFLFLHGYDVHGQNTPGEGYDYRFVDKDYDGRFIGSELEQEALREEGLNRGRLNLRDEDVRFWRAVYDEKIQRADEKFRLFLADFDKLGVSDRTLFVLTSDHGTELYEHQRLDHGFTLYDEQLRVPLILKMPGWNGGRRTEDRVSSLDVMPTILDLLDVQPSEHARQQLRGTSLVPAMKGEPVASDLFAETDYRAYTFKRAIVSPDGWKLIFSLETQTRELYDLKTDPAETNNLAAAERARADELQRRLFARFQSIGHDLASRRWETGLNPVYPSQGKVRPK